MSGLLAESDFIHKALDIHCSSGDGGTGLAAVDYYIKRWKGILSMRSGTARLIVENGQRISEDQLLEIPGTQVGITVRAG